VRVNNNNTTPVDSLRCVISIALLAAMTPAAVVLGPIIVGAYVTDLGFAADTAGYLIAAELVGAGIATAVAYVAVGRFDWHSIIRVALAGCMFGNVISIFATDVAVLLPVRFFTGIAVGTIMTMTIVIVGMTRDQERNFGYWSMGQVVFAVIGFAIFPHIMPLVGVAGFFAFMAVIMALQQLVVRNMPAAGNPEHAAGFSSLPPDAKKLVPVALLALLFFYIGIGSVWAYVERIGDQSGLDAEVIGYALSGSAVVGVFGAALATWMSTRFGRLMPALLGYLMIALAMSFYFGTQTTVIFLVASLLYKFAWWFMSPYLLANMTTLDPSGRVAILTNFVIGFGLGVGPAIAAMLIGSGESLNYSRVVVFGVGSVIVSVLLLLPVVRMNASKTVLVEP